MKGSRRNGCRKAATTSRLGESGQGETKDPGSTPDPALGAEIQKGVITCDRATSYAGSAQNENKRPLV